MAINLYTEAIAEAKQLRDMAEQNAKNKIIDAVTPQIRQLIEQQIGAAIEDEDVDLDPDAEDSVEMDAEVSIEDQVPAGDEPEAMTPMTLDLDSMVGAEEFDVEMEASPGGPTVVNVDSNAGAEVNVSAGGVDISAPGVEVNVGGDDVVVDDDELILSTESARALARLLSRPQVLESKEIASRLVTLHRQTRRLDRVLEGYNGAKFKPSQRKIVRNLYRKLLREAITLRDQVIISEGQGRTKGLSERANQVFKEIKEMARHRRSTLFDRLFEGDDEKQELDELDAVLSLEPADDEEAEEVEALLGDLDVEFEIEAAEEEEVEVEDVEVGEEEIDLGGEEIAAEEEVDVEMEEMGMYGETDVVEIDEAMLRRELLRMRRIREQAEAADADPYLDHGGEDEGDLFVDVDEDSLLNALADELGDPGVPTPEVGGRPAGGDAMGEARLRRRIRARLAETRRKKRRSRRNAPRKVNESRNNRALKGKLNEYRKAVGSLRGQLTEMNLFNAKLLYANKLMQNRNVTPKQQRVIVEALDKAKTIREAQLLYQSLSASANKKGGNLSEGRARRQLGSASKSARSAQPLTEGAGSVDRWAVLAGIPGKNDK